MTIDANIEVFAGKKIINFSADSEINPDAHAVRLTVDYDDADDGVTLLSLVKQLSQSQIASKVTHLVIGAWEESYDTSPQEAIDFLSSNSSLFPSLRYVFFGEMTVEESEISWIQQTDYENFLKNYPELLHFQVRGGEGLALSNLNHQQLETLVVETGGLDKSVVQSIVEAELPLLKHLELWLGEENYGWNGSLEQLQMIVNKFGSQLVFLGLKNSEIQDDVAVMLSRCPEAWKNVSTLDLSMGILGDKGGEALLSCENTVDLALLNLEYHYLSDEMMQKLTALSSRINVKDKQEVDVDDGEEYRYIAVGE